MSNVDTQVLLDGLKQYAEVGKFKEIIDTLNNKGWLKKIVGGLTLIPLAVTIVEKIHGDLTDVQGGGKEKKEAVVEWLDSIIKVGIVLEAFDGLVIRLGIDAIVGMLNLVKGKTWLDSAKDFLGIE